MKEIENYLIQLGYIQGEHSRTTIWYNPKIGKMIRISKVIPARPEILAGIERTVGNHTSYSNRNTAPVSHIAYKIMTGSWPPKGMEIDHKDRDTTNIKWDNLRLATRLQNVANTKAQPRQRSDTVGLPRNVYRTDSGAYFAQVMRDGIQYRTGVIWDLTQVIQAAESLRREHHGDFRVHDSDLYNETPVANRIRNFSRNRRF